MRFAERVHDGRHRLAAEFDGASDRLRRPPPIDFAVASNTSSATIAITNAEVPMIGYAAIRYAAGLAAELHAETKTRWLQSSLTSADGS